MSMEARSAMDGMSTRDRMSESTLDAKESALVGVDASANYIGNFGLDVIVARYFSIASLTLFA